MEEEKGLKVLYVGLSEGRDVRLMLIRLLCKIIMIIIKERNKR